MFVLFSLLILLFIPNIVSADCVNLERYTDWVREDEYTIVFYMGNIPLARLNTLDCGILPSSKIRLIKSYMCDDDTIVVDGKTCNIVTLEALD
jgi:hypothetical protein